MKNTIPRILVVDDEPAVLNLLVYNLNKAHYQVMTAVNGRQALEIALQAEPDLILLDLMLPEIDGLDVCRELRRTSKVPIIMITARGEEIDRVVGLELGADDYICKPFSMRELVARVHALLRRIEHVQAILAADQRRDTPPVTVGPLHLDPAARLASLDGVPLDLTHTEFDLLHLFLRNPGRAFSRSYLLDTVWGEDYVAGDRSVDNAVLRLRKKLGAWGEAIETVWSIGYRLTPKEPA